MDFALLLARLVLAGVFVVAGVAKLADLRASRAAMADFGIPGPLAPVFAVAVPLAELTLAILLVPVATAAVAATLALLMLAGFTAGVAVNLARGRAPECNCFGSLSGRPIGPGTLVRNVALMALAAFVAIGGWDDPGYGLVAWVRGLSAATRVGLFLGLAFAAFACVVVWVMVLLLRRYGALLLRVDELEARGQANAAAAAPAAGLAVGSPAPAFRLDGVRGDVVTLDSLRAAGKPTLLMFADPSCGPCNALMPEVGRWAKTRAAELTVALVSTGGVEVNLAKAEEHDLPVVLVQEKREVRDAYRVNGTPAAVVVGADGRILSSTAQGADEIRSLVEEATWRPGGPVELPMAAPSPAHTHAQGSARPTPVAAVGELAPSIELPDLAGKTVRLEDFRGAQTAVLFWRPGCGFCQRMLPDLLAWEGNRTHDAPSLVLVSSEGSEANEAMGLRSPILLEESFSVGYRFGVTGTPSAVLIDEEGNVASAPAVGAPAVLALLEGAREAHG